MITNYFNLLEEHRDKVRASLRIHAADEFGVEIKGVIEKDPQWYTTDGIGKFGPKIRKLSNSSNEYQGVRFGVRESLGVGVVNPSGLQRLTLQRGSEIAAQEPPPEFDETEWNQHRSRLAGGIEDDQEYLEEVLMLSRTVLRSGDAVQRYYATLTVFEVASARERLRRADNPSEHFQRGVSLLTDIIAEIEDL